MTREDLKSLVRECLVEIITEGAGASRTPRTTTREPATARVAAIQDVPRRKTIGGMSLDRPAIQQEGVQRRPAQQDNTMVSRITSDPILSSIFADTAATTLQEQISAERMRPGASADPISRFIEEKEPSDIFGDAARNWSALAFGKDPAGQ